MSDLGRFEDGQPQCVEKGEDSCEFMGESREDISGLAQVVITPLAEKGSSEVLLIVKIFTNGMSQRCFANSG